MSIPDNRQQLASEALIRRLESISSGGVRRNVSLREISWYKIGGPADVVVEPKTTESAASVMRCLTEHNALYTVIGSMSNILFDDAGYRGVLVKIADTNFNELHFKENGTVQAGAGFWVPCYVRNVIKRGLEGCVHAIGIPGALGGLIIMNGGSLRHGIGEQLVNVTVIDKSGEIQTLTREECNFGYRSSALQTMECLITGATFRYESKDPKLLRKQALDLLAQRSTNFPRKYPSCGSVFLSTSEMYGIIGPPGKAIEDLGFKGKTEGGALISPVHANFIVNTGGATARDVLSLIHQCREAIREKSGFDLKCEVRFLPAEGKLCSAHIQADKIFVK